MASELFGKGISRGSGISKIETGRGSGIGRSRGLAWRAVGPPAVWVGKNVDNSTAETSCRPTIDTHSHGWQPAGRERERVGTSYSRLAFSRS